ncbi:hypothetical protein [Lacihabitans lacunae]|uniref:DUF4200 domain-containing protein n=1 Tax=Lacihabitans lacunae TaxID=1028214 RepID=A0ABV7Z2C7_9BACT
MNELSQNVNIRTSYDFKRKVMAEANERRMRMSEYLTNLIQDYWEMEEKGELKSSKFENEEYEKELKNYQVKLEEKARKIKTLESKINSYEEKFEDFQNNYQSSVLEKSNRILEQWKQSELKRIENEIKEQKNAELDTLNKLYLKTKENYYENSARLERYETDLLMETFDFVNGQSNEDVVADMPTLVNILVTMYYNQFILPTLNQTQYA